MTLKISPLLIALALVTSMAASGCLTTVQQGGACGSSTLSGQLAFPVRAGMVFKDPQADKYVVWLWDVYDAGIGQDSSNTAEDWVSWCGAIADAGYNSGERLPQRLLLLTLNPPLSGAHSLPGGMTGTYYEQHQQQGLGATAGSLNVTTTAECMTGPLQLTFTVDGGSSPLSGQISVPLCGPI
jgi:hypothetical protein